MKGDQDKNVLGFPTNKDLLKKLDFISGVINTIEGILRKTIVNKLVTISINLDVIFDEVQKLNDKSSFHFSSIKLGNSNFKVEGRITKFTMNEFQFIDAAFEAKKKNGQPAKVQNPSAETDHPEMVIAEIMDEKTARFTAIENSVTEVTAVLCTVKADADLGEGVREISVVGSLTLTPGEAETLTLTFGEPQDKPTA